jgi:hypothetical protein
MEIAGVARDYKTMKNTKLTHCKLGHSNKKVTNKTAKQME